MVIVMICRKIPHFTYNKKLFEAILAVAYCQQHQPEQQSIYMNEMLRLFIYMVLYDLYNTHTDNFSTFRMVVLFTGFKYQKLRLLLRKY